MPAPNPRRSCQPRTARAGSLASPRRSGFRLGATGAAEVPWTPELAPRLSVDRRLRRPAHVASVPAEAIHDALPDDHRHGHQEEDSKEQAYGPRQHDERPRDGRQRAVDVTDAEVFGD